MLINLRPPKFDPESTFLADLQAAYDGLTIEFHGIGRTSDGLPRFPEHDDMARREINRAIARCAAAVSAAVKREKRWLVLRTLQRAKDHGLDITPTVVQNTARRFLGRGLDQKAVATLFATPGRTAANHSPVRAADLVQFERELVGRMQVLLFEMDLEKSKASHLWATSVERKNVLADWSRQRLAQLRGRMPK
ncbi:hypothetical protein RBA41_28660 [Massilia sp. CCM 9210]|uniref:hypothetical protein n=1 Tax=Massilia scottii TaxID=3057166 RepID=UPI0027968CFE|nr:hypothetical protein [Massilia sp. CCM 9210]MDQ1817284.1 hypothetical protein [Massilia sp. CCM 9210]